MAVTTRLTGISVLVAALALVGCQQASSPSTVERDVSNAKATAQKDDAKASQQDAKTVANANADLSDAEHQADVKKSDSAIDVAVTEAEGRHDIAIVRCNALAGDQQKACKDQADAALELAKANAKAQKVALKNGN
jgi:hypothetical protein